MNQQEEAKSKKPLTLLTLMMRPLIHLTEGILIKLIYWTTLSIQNTVNLKAGQVNLFHT